MVSHEPHPIGLAILEDGCKRCDYQAEHPLEELDHARLWALWDRMLKVEKQGGHYASANEAKAARVLHSFAIFLELHTYIKPSAVIEDYWK